MTVLSEQDAKLLRDIEARREALAAHLDKRPVLSEEGATAFVAWSEQLRLWDCAFSELRWFTLDDVAFLLQLVRRLTGAEQP